MTIWQDDRMTGNKSCLILPKVVKNSKVAKCWQMLANFAKKLSKVAKRYQKKSKIAKYCNKLLKNDQQFCWNSIITKCNLPSPNYGRPLHPKLPPTRMTHIPSSMIKMTIDFVETSLSSVHYHCQIMVVHCTQNCHLLVWPIYQAQWSKLQHILLKHHHYIV